jgi:hypothetical protein
MNPLEIAEHKMRWMRAANHPVRIHSDLDVAGKDWCRRNLERQEWSFQSWTDVYEHTFYFENATVSQQFEHEFKDWIQR